MLAVWVEQLLGYASGALKAIRRDERYPTLVAWAREEGPALVCGKLPMAQALAPELWSQTPLERLDFPAEPLSRPVRNVPRLLDTRLKTKQIRGSLQLTSPVPGQLKK